MPKRDAALDAGQAQPVARVVAAAPLAGTVEWLPHNGEPLRIGDTLYAAPQASQPVAPAGWKCGKCGVDRTKHVCPLGHSAALDGRCPMIAMALSAAAPAPAAQPLKERPS